MRASLRPPDRTRCRTRRNCRRLDPPRTRHAGRALDPAAAAILVIRADLTAVVGKSIAIVLVRLARQHARAVRTRVELAIRRQGARDSARSAICRIRGEIDIADIGRRRARREVLWTLARRAVRREGTRRGGFGRSIVRRDERRRSRVERRVELDGLARARDERADQEENARRGGKSGTHGSQLRTRLATLVRCADVG